MKTVLYKIVQTGHLSDKCPPPLDLGVAFWALYPWPDNAKLKYSRGETLERRQVLLPPGIHQYDGRLDALFDEQGREYHVETDEGGEPFIEITKKVYLGKA